MSLKTPISLSLLPDHPPKNQPFCLFTKFFTTKIPIIDLAQQSSPLHGEIQKIKTKQAKLPNSGKGKGLDHHKLYLIFFPITSIIRVSLSIGHSRLVVHSSTRCPPKIQHVGQSSGWELGESRLAKETNLNLNSRTSRNNDIISYQNFVALGHPSLLFFLTH